MEVVVLFMFVMMTVGVVTAIVGRGAGRHRQIDEDMTRVLQELERMNERLNDVDERLADMTMMIDEVSRPAVSDGRSARD